MVSIVTPVYKAEKVIAETIQSVLNQTYTDWELILVDDCSPDKSYEAIEPFLTDERIRYVKLDKNSRAAAARNNGMDAAQGKFIAFLDATTNGCSKNRLLSWRREDMPSPAHIMPAWTRAEKKRAGL